MFTDSFLIHIYKVEEKIQLRERVEGSLFYIFAVGFFGIQGIPTTIRHVLPVVKLDTQNRI